MVNSSNQPQEILEEGKAIKKCGLLKKGKTDAYLWMIYYETKGKVMVTVE